MEWTPQLTPSRQQNPSVFLSWITAIRTGPWHVRLAQPLHELWGVTPDLVFRPITYRDGWPCRGRVREVTRWRMCLPSPLSWAALSYNWPPATHPAGAFFMPLPVTQPWLWTRFPGWRVSWQPPNPQIAWADSPEVTGSHSGSEPPPEPAGSTSGRKAV